MARKLFGFQQLAASLKTLALILFFYTFSISLTFYNKWMLKVGYENIWGGGGGALPWFNSEETFLSVNTTPPFLSFSHLIDPQI